MPKNETLTTKIVKLSSVIGEKIPIERRQQFVTDFKKNNAGLGRDFLDAIEQKEKHMDKRFEINQTAKLTPEESEAYTVPKEETHIDKIRKLLVSLSEQDQLEACSIIDKIIVSKMEKECNHAKSSGCACSCDVDSDAAFLKRSLDEVKLLNIRSYSSLIFRVLENATHGGVYRLGDDLVVFDRSAMDDCFVLLHHLDETIKQLLPE